VAFDFSLLLMDGMMRVRNHVIKLEAAAKQDRTKQVMHGLLLSCRKQY